MYFWFLRSYQSCFTRSSEPPLISDPSVRIVMLLFECGTTAAVSYAASKKRKKGSVPLHGESDLSVKQGFNATEQVSHAFALRHNCGYTQVSDRGLTKRFVKHCVEDNRGARQQVPKSQSDFHTIRVRHGEV